VGERRTSLAEGVPAVVRRMEQAIETVADELTTETQAHLPADRRLLGVSILALLSRSYPTDAAVASLARLLMAHAGVFARFDGTQRTLTQYGPDADLGRFVVLPEDPAHAAFAERLTRALRASGGLTASEEFPAIPYVLRSREGMPVMNELTLLAHAHGMPARYLAACQWLKDRYERRAASEGEFVRYVVHSEGTGGHVPELFPLTERELDRTVRRYILLGIALGRVMPLNGGGEPGFILRYRDEDALERDLRIPGHIHHLGRFDEDAGARLIREVDAEVVQMDRARREKVREWLVAEQGRLRSSAGAHYEPEVLPLLKAALETVRTS
jgi:hypothetical protein